MTAILRKKTDGSIIGVKSESRRGDVVWVGDNGEEYGVVGASEGEYVEQDINISDITHVGAYIKNVRKSKNISIRTMASACKVSPTTIVNIENGKYCPRMDIFNEVIEEINIKLKISLCNRLVLSDLHSLTGKTIEWSAAADTANCPYVGVAKIVDVDLTQSRPIQSETVSGCDLKWAFIDNGLLCYSDSDRFVTYRII